MANTLTDLAPDLYAALDVVSRELVGFIPAVNTDSTIERAAVGQDVIIYQTGDANVSDISPAMSTPEPTNQVVGNTKVQITKSRAAEFGFVGEEQRALRTGAGYLSVQGDLIAQAMRKLVNEMESDIASTYIGSSRAFGTSGTTPFGSNLSEIANMQKILEDNGAWQEGNMNAVINTTAGVNMSTLTQLTNVNEAGDNSLLRQGVLTDLFGFKMRKSAGVKNHTKGTGTNYLVNGAKSEGDTVITLDTGSGTILAGDVITFAGDSNKYVVATALNGNNVVIAKPGLMQDLADNTAVTVQNGYSANMAFARNAIVLATRAPEVPAEGDMAIDRMMITDPRSGISFEVSIYPGYRKVRYEIALAWGAKNIKPEHSAILLG